MTKKKISVSKVIRTIVWPHRGRILIGLVLILLSKLAGLVIPGAFKFLIDDVILNKDTQMLNLIVLAVVGAVSVQAISSFLLTKLLSIKAHRVIANLRLKIQQKIIRLPLAFFEKHKSGEIAKRIMDDIDGIKNLIGTGLILLIGGVITSVGAFIILLYIHPKLTAYTVIPLILMGFISLKAYTYLRPIYRKRRAIEADVQGRLIETLGGMRVVKGYNAEDHEESAFKSGVDYIFSYYKKSMTAQALIISLATLILGLASGGMMWLGSNMIIDDKLEMGEFISFILYLGFMVSPIIQMSNIGSLLTEAFAGLDRTEELMNIPSELDNDQRTQQMGIIKGDLSFNEVSFAYGDGPEVLRGISFEVPQGSSVALVGPSGGGKSTIAGLIATFMEPTRGAIHVDNTDISKVHLDSFRSQLGIVLQDDFLFDGTIRENILFSNPEADESSLQDAVIAANVNEFTDRFPDGLETVIGERGVKLSGGQKQRISIARALLSNPRILILDEATSSLDMESEALIQESLAKLIEGRTTVIIAHRLSTIRNADLILVIEDGQIAERGTHDSLLALQQKYHKLVSLQSRI